MDNKRREKTQTALTAYIRKCNSALAACRDLEEKCYSGLPGSPLRDGMPRAHGVKSDLSDIFISTEEAREKAVAMAGEMQTVLRESVAWLEDAKLSPGEYAVIYERYLHPYPVRVFGRTISYTMQPWDEVARVTGHSYASCMVLHARALKKLDFSGGGCYYSAFQDVCNMI